MEYVELSTGAKMPLLGLGTWQSKPGEVKQAVTTALEAGYRLIDTAFIYGNETEIGEAIKEFIASGKVKREDLFITTKLWTPFFKRENVPICLKKSLEKLQLSYVDLYLIHVPCAMKKAPDGDSFEVENGKPVFEDIPLEETWKGMEDVYNLGLTKAIGLSNFNVNQTQRIYDFASVKPHNNQVECHVYFPQIELYNHCKNLGISFTAYAPIGSPGRMDFKPAGRSMNWPDPGNMLENTVVSKIAHFHKKTPAQVLIRWLIQRGISTIPKSVTETRIKENFNVFDFTLSEEQMEQLSNLKVDQRLFLAEFAKGSPEDPFKDER